MRRFYENPPIIEAICEFQFEPSQSWDWTIPGLIYAEVKADFPKKRHQNVLKVELSAGKEEIAQNVKGGITRMQFLRNDERALIQVGPDFLAVNHLKPYPNWEIFKGMVVHALKVYHQVANPRAIRRIGLRYVNRIELPEQRVEIENYLLAVPKVPEEVPQVFATWVQRVEIPFESANGLLVLQSGSIREDGQSRIAFLLDLDFISLQANTVALDSAMEWVEKAHHEVERTFEACITSKTRDLFMEVTRNE